jgi:hypothetical protein
MKKGGNQPNLEAIVKSIRPFFFYFIEYQEFLSDIDVVAAKANMPIVLMEFYQQLRKIVVCISEMPTTQFCI